jgi:hypothetical protein
MRRLLWGLLWFVKGTLLTIALLSLAMWPWSSEHWGWISLSRSSRQSDGVELAGVLLKCGGSHVGFIKWEGKMLESSSSIPHAQTATQNTRWQWNVESGTLWLLTPHPDRPWIPFQFSSTYNFGPGFFYNTRGSSLPFWRLSIYTGVWPAISIAIALCRRSIRGRLARAGRCANCGYDLRATPNRCPECGRPVTSHQSDQAPPAPRT